jgi:hypothetical protein
VRVEDAYAIERRAIELQFAPLRLERPRAGTYRWGVEPEIALGLFPRTQIEIGVPVVHVESASRARLTALRGLEFSALYNLNAETRLPALAIAADVTLPVGGLATARAIPSITAIATKTMTWGRVHANVQRTFVSAEAIGAARVDATANAEFTRWMAGLAVDRTLPLRSLLFTAELVTSAPVVVSEPQQWDVAAGMRYQLSPRMAVDAGGGYRLRGDEPGWFVTSGAAVAVGLPTFGRAGVSR